MGRRGLRQLGSRTSVQVGRRSSGGVRPPVGERRLSVVERGSTNGKAHDQAGTPYPSAGQRGYGSDSRTTVPGCRHPFSTLQDVGGVLQNRNTVEKIYSDAGVSAPKGKYLSADDVEREATLPTTLRRLTMSEFARLRRHGFEVADATLATRLPNRFAHREVPG